MKLLDALVPARGELVSSRPGIRERLTLSEAMFAGGQQFLGGMETINVGGQAYTLPVMTTLPGQKSEGIANSFEGYILAGLNSNPVVFGLVALRLRLFSEARFQFQRFNNGRPGDLFGDTSLSILEHPWEGGVTGDLLALMLLHSDMAGNCYLVEQEGQVIAMRPDWVDILLQERMVLDSSGRRGILGMKKVGYAYWHGGRMTGRDPITFLADEVVHFAPQPDPLAWYRGMSWLTPITREIQADQAAIKHKLAFFENAATPNLAVSLKEITDPDQFETFIEKMEKAHVGGQNAGRTLYMGAGADVTVIGQNMHEMDFVNVIARAESRLAAAAGVPATIAGVSEGLQGSSLNSGNFAQARRQMGDMTLHPLWRNASGSLEMICPPPGGKGSRLWYDVRDVPFLRMDVADEADIHQKESQAIRELFMAGFEPDSIIAAVQAGGDWSLLKHTGMFSVQVQMPGPTSTKLPSEVYEVPPANSEASLTGKELPPATAVQAAKPVQASTPTAGSNGKPAANDKAAANGKPAGR